MTGASEIRSATISCGDLDQSLRFWRDAVGFEEVWRGSAGGRELERAWALPAGTGAEVVLLRYDGIATGQLRLVRFTPHTGVYSRTEADARSAVGVVALDAATRDGERAYALLREAGYESPSPAPHFYEIAGLRQSEVIFFAPDHVRFLTVGAIDYPPEIARAELPGDFSPLTTISQFVADMDASSRFYGEGLGLEAEFDAVIEEPDRATVNEMVGLPAETVLRLALYRSPGEPDGKPLLIQGSGPDAGSVAERMRPPNLGIVMLSHATADLEGLCVRLVELGGSVVSEPAEVDLGEGAAVRCLVRAPRGILLELYEES